MEHRQVVRDAPVETGLATEVVPETVFSRNEGNSRRCKAASNEIIVGLKLRDDCVGKNTQR